LSTALVQAQAYNPFTQSIKFAPEPSVDGFSCGVNTTVQFIQGLSTQYDAPLVANDPLEVKICIAGFTWNGANAAAVVSGSYTTNFNWAFDPLDPNCLIGTQNGTIPGTGSNPLFPNPAAAGPVILALSVPGSSTVGTVLSVDVSLSIPAYMIPTNSTPDDLESTQTITNCNISISGTVFNDVNGLTNSNVDGVGVGNPCSTQLYANLIDNAGDVEQVTTVAANGSYILDSIVPNSNYTVLISTIQGTVGMAAPAVNLPCTWINTGEDCCDNVGDDGTVDGIVAVTVGVNDVIDVNFGIQEPPLAGTNTLASQVNPGGTNCVNIPATAFSGTDASGGIISFITLCSCPTNINGIVVNSVLYDCTNFPAAGLQIPTNAAGEPTQSICVDPIDGATTVQISYSVTDNGGATSLCDGTIDVPFSSILISGNVFNDIDALTDTDVDGVGIGVASGSQLYVNLADPSGNVVDVATVAANGTYSFEPVNPNTNYTLVLSTVQGTVGNALPAATLPAAWVNTGESPNNATSDGTVDGTTTVSVVTTNIPLVDFGIQEPPTPGTNTQSSQVNPGGTNCANVPANAFSGVDPSGGTINFLTICSCPTNATSITVDNVQYDCATFPVGGIQVPTNAAGEPTQTICVDPISGATTVQISYSLTDNGGATSACSGTVDIPYSTINLSGRVLNDFTGPANVNGIGLGNPDNTPLYANLADQSGNVVGTALVAANGNYTIVDVAPNATFTVSLSTTQGIIGNAVPSPSLPNGWANVSEDCCDYIGNDGTTDGMVTVVMASSNATQANFGIEELFSIGNSVWIDANKNGILDNGELPMVGATVNLYEDTNLDGVPDGASIATMTTDANGLYLFKSQQGNYVVSVIPIAAPANTSYTSSAINETIADNDVDNNDNGITYVAANNEYFSSTINIVSGGEPTAENPDNDAVTKDANENLTIDFGFFECPNAFSFPTLSLCADSTTDLTSFEPADNSGGTWNLGANAVADPTSAASGETYTYTYTNGDCSASGDLIITSIIPDYVPTIAISPSAIVGQSPIRTIISVSELNNLSSCSPVFVLVPKDIARFVFTWAPSSINAGGISVNNPDWTYYSTNASFHIWEYTAVSGFPVGGISRIGFIGSYNPNNTDGQTTLTVQIFGGSGGEINALNNSDSESLLYFR